MPPLRRYLRISPHSVLETRIYLDNPTDLHRWLLSPASPALPRVIEAVRPLVLPKLREENDIAKGKGKGKSKGKRKSGVKDTVTTDDFTVSIFLTQLSTRHSILRKSKLVKPDPSTARRSTSRLTRLGNLASEPLDVDAPPTIRRETSSSSNEQDISAIPAVDPSAAQTRNEPVTVEDDSEDGDGDNELGSSREEDDGDGKKKLGFRTSYAGFAIYGRILCLVVKRKTGGGVGKGKEMRGGAGQAMMEEWIGTQVAREEEGGVIDG